MRRHLISIFLLLIICSACGYSRDSTIHYPVPNNIKQNMMKHSWKPGCPVPIKDLAYLRVAYWGYDGKAHQGELVVHKDVSKEVVRIFEDLFSKRFPIEKMRLIDEYGGSDDASMADNNTSAFNCRPVTGRTDKFSNHSYGKAIDINPLVNPYVKKDVVLPKEGKPYVDRTQAAKGMTRRGDVTYNVFVGNGWKWGGDWKSLKDYQHFEKE